MTPEFSHIVALDTIGAEERTITLEADNDQCRRLAGRFGWIGIGRLAATVRLVMRANGVDATGHLTATINQKCVATGEPVREDIDTDFTVRFIDSATLGDHAEIELGQNDLDIVEFTGAGIDIGEAIAETLALSADPYPRRPDADAMLRAHGVGGEGGTGAFAGLRDMFSPR